MANRPDNFRGLDLTSLISRCVVCGREVEKRSMGRPRKYCGGRCQEKARPKTEKRRQATRAYYRGYYQRNREKVLEKNREHKSPEKQREYSASYRNRNREKVLASVREHHHKNRAAMLEKKRKYRIENPEKVRQWAKDHPEKVREYARDGNHRRRARKTQAGGTYTRAEWQALLDLYDHRCLKCGVTGVTLSVDHVIPISAGGRNDIGNIQPLCIPCNSRKHNKTIDYRPGAICG
jgi:5-methylcytosine-specific restriction endonuclease McrA